MGPRTSSRCRNTPIRNAVLQVDLKLASKSKDAQRVTVAAPIVNAPVMLAEWKLEPDAGQRLAFVKGSLTPVGGVPDVSGFAQLTRMFNGGRVRLVTSAAMALGVVARGVDCLALGESRGRLQIHRPSHLGTVLGLVAIIAGGTGICATCWELAEQHRGFTPGEVAFLAPVQQSGSALSVEVANVSRESFGRRPDVQPLVARAAGAGDFWRWPECVKRAGAQSALRLLGWTRAGVGRTAGCERCAMAAVGAGRVSVRACLDPGAATTWVAAAATPSALRAATMLLVGLMALSGGNKAFAAGSDLDPALAFGRARVRHPSGARGRRSFRFGHGDDSLVGRERADAAIAL